MVMWKHNESNYLSGAKLRRVNGKINQEELVTYMG